MAYDIPYMWNVKGKDTDGLINRKRLTDFEKEHMVARGKG